jgi:low affinity Fe/Cu permease
VSFRIGYPAAFSPVGVIVVWAATGSVFDYSDTWYLVINTGTTIVTFLTSFRRGERDRGCGERR